MTSLRKLTIKQRQQLIKGETLSSLKNISRPSYDLSLQVTKNCENIIGVAQVPMGIVGPLKLQNSDGLYVPLATTEGALIASVNRGCKAVSVGMGVNTYSKYSGTTRGPFIQIKDIKQAKEIIYWIDNNWQFLEKTVKSSSNHTFLKRYNYKIFGKNLYLKFFFDTGEAMGMNMVSIATKLIMEELINQFDIEQYLTSGNFCSDKKPSFTSLYEGKGREVWAETIVKKDIVKKILKTTPKELVQTVKQKTLIGSIASGSLGFNSHFANIVAAFYLATGQDLAHVVEGSLGITTAEMQGEDLYFSVYLPSVMLGSIGGGTGLPTQSEAMQIMNIRSGEKNSSNKLSEILVATVLAGELSLLAALTSKNLVCAHLDLARD